MQRFVRNSVTSRVRFLLQDPMTLIRPAAIGGTSANAPKCLHYVANNQLLHTCLFLSPSRTMKIYTGTGDKGTSALFTGERRSKTDAVFDALGAVDELSCAIAMALAQLDLYLDKPTDPKYNLRELCSQLDLIQRRLQALGSSVATPIPSSSDPNASDSEIAEKRRARFAHVNFPEDAASVELETWIDEMTKVLPPLRQFILPSGGSPGTFLHFARAVCRRAERRVLALNLEHVVVESAALVYMNRLSDYLFTAARYASCGLGLAEKHYNVPRPPKK